MDLAELLESEGLDGSEVLDWARGRADAIAAEVDSESDLGQLLAGAAVDLPAANVPPSRPPPPRAEDQTRPPIPTRQPAPPAQEESDDEGEVDELEELDADDLVELDADDLELLEEVDDGEDDEEPPVQDAEASAADSLVEGTAVITGHTAPQHVINEEIEDDEQVFADEEDAGDAVDDSLLGDSGADLDLDSDGEDSGVIDTGLLDGDDEDEDEDDEFDLDVEID